MEQSYCCAENVSLSSEGLQVKDVIEDMVRVLKASLPRVSMSHVIHIVTVENTLSNHHCISVYHLLGHN